MAGNLKKGYIMVQIGKQFIRQKRANDTNQNPLTKDFREAKIYKKRKAGELIPWPNTLKVAKKDAEEYGGKVVFVSVTIEDWKDDEE